MQFRRMLTVFPLAALSVFAQSAGNWTLTPLHPTPPPRDGPCVVYDSVHGQVLMIGGMNTVDMGGFVLLNYLTDTWTWNAATMTWSQVNTPSTYSAPGPCVYDSAHGQVVLVTTSAYFSGSLDQTWLFDGKTWTQASPKNMPSGRAGFAMAYDSAHGQVVLFGGSSPSSGGNQETWVWDGANWTQMSPKTSPPARHDHVMTYDSLHGQVVLFGGEFTNTASFTTNVYTDTWTWDGTNWTKQSPTTQPTATLDSAIAFDAAHGHLVLYGGTDGGNNIHGETWIWDGSNWTQQMPQISPAAEAGAGMAFDASHSNMVLTGGINVQGTYLNSTSLWSEGTPTVTQPVVTSVIGASGYGGLPLVAPGSWIEIYGYDLSALTRLWAAADFNGSTAPVSLSGVQVSIAGQPAFVEYIAAGASGSQGQLNVQVPAGVPPGVQQLIVKNGGTTGQPFSVNAAGTAPGLLAPSSFAISGNQYAVALFSDNATYVLPAGAISGVPSRAAKAGDVITLYGVGFGSVTPASAPGQIVAQQNQLSQPFQISIGGKAAKLDYWGLAPGYVGLYQFDAEVPAVTANNPVPLTFTLNGVPGTQTLYTAISQ